jgi:hypothetical protein
MCVCTMMCGCVSPSRMTLPDPLPFPPGHDCARESLVACRHGPIVVMVYAHIHTYRSASGYRGKQRGVSHKLWLQRVEIVQDTEQVCHPLNKCVQPPLNISDKHRGYVSYVSYVKMPMYPRIQPVSVRLPLTRVCLDALAGKVACGGMAAMAWGCGCGCMWLSVSYRTECLVPTSPGRI